MKPNGQEYYCYILVYVDDVLHVYHNPGIDMKLLIRFYRLKDGVGSPSRYLGANIEMVKSEDSREVWSMTCVDYIKSAIRNVNDTLEKDKVVMKMFGDGHRPYPSSYRPEMDVSELISDTLINRYQQLIGMLRWSIELGWIYIHTELSCLS